MATYVITDVNASVSNRTLSVAAKLWLDDPGGNILVSNMAFTVEIVKDLAAMKTSVLAPFEQMAEFDNAQRVIASGCEAYLEGRTIAI